MSWIKRSLVVAGLAVATPFGICLISGEIKAEHVRAGLLLAALAIASFVVIDTVLKMISGEKEDDDGEEE